MSKTPVSILQEYCTRHIITPHYDLVVNGVGTHDPLFRYKLTVNDIITYGEGKSKKEAKHEAAREALTLLPVCNTNKFNAVEPEMSEQVEDITSPYHGALKENAIGELITICANNKLPAPEYILTGDEGLPHAKLFTFECHVAKLIETAASRTKKQAKHLSAKLMLQRLKTMLGDKLELTPPDPIDETKDHKTIELDENAKLAYANLKTTKVNENFDLLIKDYHTIDLTPVFGDNPSPVIKLSHYNVDGYSGVSPENLLEELFKEAEVAVNVQELPSIKNNFIITYELDSCPSFVVYSVGSDKQKVRSEAAHKMLCLLKLFCHGINQ